MKREKQRVSTEKSPLRRFPPLGQRILKTTVAVFLCLLFYWLRGYRGQAMPTEAAITAIVCMQPYSRDSWGSALDRFTGTMLGTFWGLAFLLVVVTMPIFQERMLLAYLLMGLGTLASLYSAVLVRKPGSAALAAIVFLCVVIAFPDIQDPLRQTSGRILGVALGTVVAIGVDHFRLPRRKDRSCVFFERTRDLAPDRFSQIPSAALYRLNYLFQDGAKICLMSEHAPAFFALQLTGADIPIPLIVMGGAAIYDANENVYLYAETLRANESQRLREHLDRLGLSYFIYAIHRNKTCIFHQGAMRPEEEQIFRRMKRSPYRIYLEEEVHGPEEVVYYKLIGTEEQTAAWMAQLQSFLHSHGLRGVLRPEAGAPGLGGLYIYAGQMSVKRAQAKLMELLRREDESLRAVDVFLDQPYRSERDAMHLLHRLGDLYEPLALFRKK